MLISKSTRDYIIISAEKISLEFKLKNINGTRNYFIKEINQNEFMSEKYKKMCQVFNYVEHLLVLVSTVNGCISISAFVSIVGIFIGITSSVNGIKICGIVKSKLNSIEVLISIVLGFTYSACRPFTENKENNDKKKNKNKNKKFEETGDSRYIYQN